MNYNAKLKTEQYRLKVIVEEEKEFVVRTLISQSVNQTDIILTNIENSNLEDGKVKIYATFKITAGKTKLLEELINRIVIEPGVISSGWNKISHMKSEEIDDDESYLLAKEIAQEIQSNVQYPGEIKVSVIRETRACAIAE